MKKEYYDKILAKAETIYKQITDKTFVLRMTGEVDKGSYMEFNYVGGKLYYGGIASDIKESNLVICDE